MRPRTTTRRKLSFAEEDLLKRFAQLDHKSRRILNHTITGLLNYQNAPALEVKQEGEAA